jgi:hypothetical protein
MLVKSDEATEADEMPSEEVMAAIGAYNDEMEKAGVMLSGEGLHPSSKGARIDYAGSDRTVADGPFADPTSLIAGYWVIEVNSKDEAIDWAKRCPFEDGQIELRQVFGAEDFA